MWIVIRNPKFGGINTKIQERRNVTNYYQFTDPPLLRKMNPTPRHKNIHKSERKNTRRNAQTPILNRHKIGTINKDHCHLVEWNSLKGASTITKNQRRKWAT